ncbi:MAG: tRNA epoxyqueuosine(34) reductase QueG [Verrucomicrobiales bacterium]
MLRRHRTGPRARLRLGSRPRLGRQINRPDPPEARHLVFPRRDHHRPLAIAPDAPLPDRCGKCTRCLDACPTQAITAPHRLDARRCLSYLTIEHKGPIPEEFRRALGDRIYGCDDCLDACPWNRFAQISRESAFALRERAASLPLRDFLALTDDGFRDLFQKSPIKRLKRPRFLRNVCIALGNAGTPDDLPALQSAAQSDDHLIAEHARWAIAEINTRFSLQNCEQPCEEPTLTAVFLSGENQARDCSRAERFRHNDLPMAKGVEPLILSQGTELLQLFVALIERCFRD